MSLSIALLDQPECAFRRGETFEIRNPDGMLEISCLSLTSISKVQNVLKVCNCRKNHPFLSILCDPPGLTSSGQNEPKCNTVVDFGVFHVVCCDLALDAEGQNRDFDQPSNVFGAFSFLLGPSIFMFFDHRKMFSWITFERKCV